jgi:hypothetical protein
LHNLKLKHPQFAARHNQKAASAAGGAGQDTVFDTAAAAVLRALSAARGGVKPIDTMLFPAREPPWNNQNVLSEPQPALASIRAFLFPASALLRCRRRMYYSATLVMRHMARLFDTIPRHAAARAPLARVASPLLVLRQKSFAARRMT